LKISLDFFVVLAVCVTVFGTQYSKAQSVSPQQAPSYAWPTAPASPNPVQLKAAQPAPKQKEETVDLNAVSTGSFISSSRSSTPTGSTAGKSTDRPAGMTFGPTAEPSLLPNFKFFFDFWLINMPGIQDLSFRNIHSYIFIDVLPNKELTFSTSFNLNGRPNFYELAYSPTPRLTIRGGKILIPFDDTYPHTLYGGRINISEFLVDPNQPFLPDLWAELGLAFKYRLVDTSTFTLDWQAYISQGFPAGGTDPVPSTGTAPNIYPNFAGDTSIGGLDNNRDKAIGGRLNALIFRKVGVGMSYYTCRWSNQSDPDLRINMIGVDSQLRFAKTGTEFRAALISMSFGVLEGTANRGGWYLEASQKLGKKREWKVITRLGYRSNDDRVIQAADQRLIGAILLWKPGLLQYSLETWRDLDTDAPKANYSLTALRAALEF
jgi:hypothetical protein